MVRPCTTPLVRPKATWTVQADAALMLRAPTLSSHTRVNCTVFCSCGGMSSMNVDTRFSALDCTTCSSQADGLTVGQKGLLMARCMVARAREACAWTRGCQP